MSCTKKIQILFKSDLLSLYSKIITFIINHVPATREFTILKTTYIINCPSCHVNQSAELVDTINADTDHEEKQNLLTNQLNFFKCPNCHFVFHVSKPVLYCDLIKGIFVYHLPVQENQSIETAINQFHSLASGILSGFPSSVQTTEILLTLERIEMIETIIMCEAGYHVRLIEYIKLDMMKKNRKVISAEEKRLLFNTQISTD